MGRNILSVTTMGYKRGHDGEEYLIKVTNMGYKRGHDWEEYLIKVTTTAS